jgi:hypothetical protein
VYFRQQFTLPATVKSGGEVQLQGDFDSGQGRYRVDWLMRDARQRVCSSHWQLKADLPEPGLSSGLTIRDETAEAHRSELFGEPDQDPQGKLRVKILANFGPPQSGLSPLNQDLADADQDDAQGPSLPGPDQERALAAMLRSIVRNPSIGQFALVAFNLRDEQILYRQAHSPKIDFPALGKALHSRPAGTISVHRLAKEHGQTEFLQDLLTRELKSPERFDAVIFAGPKVALDQNLSKASLKLLGELPFPVFYLNYNPEPFQNPWRDAIGEVVRFFKGREYTIAHPRDLLLAWKDLSSRIGERPRMSANAARE